MYIARTILPANRRLMTHAQNPGPTPLSATIARVLDQLADLELAAGRHRRAEELSSVAAEMREALL